MSNEPGKPTEARELTEKELEGINGGCIPPCVGKLQIDQIDYYLLDGLGMDLHLMADGKLHSIAMAMGGD